jgi:hypothetical protein
MAVRDQVIESTDDEQALDDSGGTPGGKRVPRAVIRARSAISGWRRHEVQVHHFKSEASDPLHQPEEGTLIWQVGAKGGRARAYGDRAVVKFRA